MGGWGEEGQSLEQGQNLGSMSQCAQGHLLPSPHARTSLGQGDGVSFLRGPQQ